MESQLFELTVFWKINILLISNKLYTNYSFICELDFKEFYQDFMLVEFLKLFS